MRLRDLAPLGLSITLLTSWAAANPFEFVVPDGFVDLATAPAEMRAALPAAVLAESAKADFYAVKVDDHGLVGIVMAKAGAGRGPVREGIDDLGQQLRQRPQLAQGRFIAQGTTELRGVECGIIEWEGQLDGVQMRMLIYLTRAPMRRP